MDSNDKYKHQQKFIAARKAEGLERLILWVKPEDKASLKEITRQPHAIAKRRAAIKAEISQELGPQIERRVEAELTRKTPAGGQQPASREDPFRVTATGQDPEPPEGVRVGLRSRCRCLALTRGSRNLARLATAAGRTGRLRHRAPGRSAGLTGTDARRLQPLMIKRVA